jgi:hypothetical protein
VSGTYKSYNIINASYIKIYCKKVTVKLSISLIKSNALKIFLNKFCMLKD